MPTTTKRVTAATSGREEETIRRYKIINGLIKEHSPVNQQETVKQFAGVVQSAWAGYLKTGKVSAKPIKHMAEFTGLSEGVFDCSANFGAKQEKAIAEALRTKIIDPKAAGEVTADEVKAEDAKLEEVKAVDVKSGEKHGKSAKPRVKADKTKSATPKKKKTEAGDAKVEATEPAIVVVEPQVVEEVVVVVEEKTEPQVTDKISAVESYVAALKATDSLGLEDVDAAVALVSALSQKVDAKKFELEALSKIN